MKAGTSTEKIESSLNEGGVVTLPEFLTTAGALSPQERAAIVDQALVLMNDLYVHLPLKRAMHAVDPVQRLRLLRRRMAAFTERKFHDEMISIFTSVRDLHTNYLLPDPYRAKTAFLPFLIEEFYVGEECQYVVSKVRAGFVHPTFRAGSILHYWSGIPMDRAVELNAERNAGSNPDARHARGLEHMTIRPMVMSLPPDEHWVDLRYAIDGAMHEIRLEWQVLTPDAAPSAVNPDAIGSTALGLDLLTESVRRAKKTLFVPQAVVQEKLAADAMASRSAGIAAIDAGPQIDSSTSSLLPDALAFRTVATPSGAFGYLRIWTFNVADAGQFVAEVIRILELLPQEGLILDLRGNGGGLITAGEQLLQLLTPRSIEPELLHFINTPLTQQLAETNDFLQPWRASIAQAVETGSTFSQGFPIEPAQNYNNVGQRYYGPVVLITDALCYSTTDIFTAGFQDHEIGPILGTSGNTGAGGANVWTHQLLMQLLPGSESPFQPLPRNCSMRVAIRRTTRVGQMSGTPVEDLGTIPDAVHRLTQNDVLGENEDLIAAAGEMLAARKPRVLSVTDAQLTDRLKFTLDTRNLSRVDLFINGRPSASYDVADGPAGIEVPVEPAASLLLEVQGYADGALMAMRRLEVNA